MHLPDRRKQTIHLPQPRLRTFLLPQTAANDGQPNGDAAMPARTARARRLADALLRSFAYVAGRWTAGAANATFPSPTRRPARPSATSPPSPPRRPAPPPTRAEAAFAGWSALLPQERSAILRRWYELIVAAREDLARLMIREQGKPLVRSARRDRLRRLLRRVLRRGGQPPEHRGRDLAPARRRGRALARARRRRRAGHAVELPLRHDDPQGRRRARRRLHRRRRTPSHETPFSALALAELAERAGFPAGVFNVVTGDAPDDRPGLDRGPPRPRPLLHRLDRGRPAALLRVAPTP